MGKEFEQRHDAEVDASPQQVWDAIATGPGISSWFVGRTEVTGDTVRTSFGDGWIPAGTVRAAEPGHRFVYAGDPAPDGRFVAYEYLIEGRDRAATVLRTVTSGFLPGDDWAGEFEAMGFGGHLFFRTLVDYLRRFPGEVLQPATFLGTRVDDWPATWRTLYAALGVGPDPAPGDRTDARLLPGGVVYCANPQALGVATGDGFYRFLQGWHGSLVLSHVLTGPPPPGRWPEFLDVNTREGFRR